MPTLILTPRHTDDSQALWRAAIEAGWDVHRLTSWRVPEGFKPVDPVLYCEALMGPTLAEQFGVRLVSPSDDWLPALPYRYRRRRIYLTTLGAARQLPEPMFVKPPNDKAFAAQVYAPDALPADFDDAMPVLVSEPVDFRSEWRFFVLNRSVRAFSLYARRGEPCSTWDRGAEIGPRLFMAKLLADDVPLPRACVVDVGYIGSGDWAVVEANAAWGAGIYGADPAECLQVIREATEEET